MSLETICPATQNVQAPGKRLTITPTSPGEISHATGVLNFFSSGKAGNFKTSTATTDGAALLSTVNGKKTGAPFSLVDGQDFGSYAMGDSSLILTYNQQPSQIFDAVYGDVDASDIIEKANLLIVSSDATPCATHVLLRLEQPPGR
jgi:hypothetical protein